nr:hypothetical protein BaRGS_003444 [Batillaria attramentaria]
MRPRRGGGGTGGGGNLRGRERAEREQVVVLRDEEDEVEPTLVEKPKDLRQLLDREAVPPSKLTTRSESVDSDERPIVVKRTLGEDDEEMDFDAELAYLMKNPPKKRMMRMHADDEEEKLKAKRARTGMLTVVAPEAKGVRSRLGGRVQQARQDVHSFDVDDDEGDILKEPDEYEDFRVPRDDVGRQRSEGDLRSKLSSRKRTGGSDRRQYPSMRIEVFD